MEKRRNSRKIRRKIRKEGGAGGLERGKRCRKGKRRRNKERFRSAREEETE
jgi:hypothetical protein